MKEVAIQSVSALASIYTALELAGLNLVGDVSEATVKVVKHKYGQDVGDSTRESLGIVQDVNLARSSITRLGVRALARATVIQSGKNLADKRKTDGVQTQNQGTATNSQSTSQPVSSSSSTLHLD